MEEVKYYTVESYGWGRLIFGITGSDDECIFKGRNLQRL
jgi:hypothetical protein